MSLSKLVADMAQRTQDHLDAGECPRCGHPTKDHENPQWCLAYDSGLLFVDCKECSVCSPEARIERVATAIRDVDIHLWRTDSMAYYSSLARAAIEASEKR